MFEYSQRVECRVYMSRLRRIAVEFSNSRISETIELLLEAERSRALVCPIGIRDAFEDANRVCPLFIRH